MGGGSQCTEWSKLNMVEYAYRVQVKINGWEAGFLYTEVQCIMGNGHTVPPTPTDRQSDAHNWKHYLPITLLASGN